jgi:hypothetical protein
MARGSFPKTWARVNALVKYSRGDRGDGYAITASAYDGSWDSTDQIPERAVESGMLNRFGYVDPTDGGDSHRYALNLEFEKPFGDWNLETTAYALDYHLDLFSNFTYAIDTDNGDQFEQFDDRQAYGIHAEVRRDNAIGKVPGKLRIGFESRLDDIDRVGLYLTEARVRRSTIREDAVQRLGLGCTPNTAATHRLAACDRRTPFRQRPNSDVDSDLEANSGSASDSIASPKLSFVFGPWADTEFFINAGRAFTRTTRAALRLP